MPKDKFDLDYSSHVNLVKVYISALADKTSKDADSFKENFMSLIVGIVAITIDTYSSKELYKNPPSQSEVAARIMLEALGLLDGAERTTINPFGEKNERI